MSTRRDEADCGHVENIPGLPAAAWTQGVERPALPARRFTSSRCTGDRTGVDRTVELGLERVGRLSKVGLFENFFETLASMSRSAHLIQVFDSTIVRAHIPAASAKGGQKSQALDRFPHAFTTKTDVKSDASAPSSP
ncbi:hypothetical protein ACSBOB_29740 [Mesorhizobium sp. ASY16-5R]|uniref:hypothetical protein n=1 Tax=Mesorhizobium sp. ASY16-5R TaxID=3445772 RepID=UPI003F9FE698